MTEITREINPERRAALGAMGLFMKVSLESPGSITAQGARIAEKCLAEKLDPSVLGTSLLAPSSADLIDSIIDKMSKAHQTSDNPRIPGEIVRDEVEGVIGSDFAEAKRLMILGPEELSGIYGSYVPGDERNEVRLRRLSDILIEMKKREMNQGKTPNPQT